MPSLQVALFVENQKLKRSLALLLAAIIPLLIAVFLFSNLLRDQHPHPWDMWMQRAAAIWAFFMLPMGVTALTTLSAQIEHTPRSWDHLRALPVPRWHFYAAKAVWVLGAVALISLCIAVISAAAIQCAAFIKPSLAPTGHFDGWRYLVLFARVYLAAFLMIAVQLWFALRFHSFVPALAAGIGGTFFAVVATSARIGVFLPWQVPVNMLATDPARANLALAWGFVGGVAGLILVLLHLGHHEP